MGKKQGNEVGGYAGCTHASGVLQIKRKRDKHFPGAPYMTRSHFLFLFVTKLTHPYSIKKHAWKHHFIRALLVGLLSVPVAYVGREEACACPCPCGVRRRRRPGIGKMPPIIQ